MNANTITSARPLFATQNAFHDLGRVSLPTATRNALSAPFTRSASAYARKLTIRDTSGTKEAIQAGGTKKKRDRLNRKWKPGGRTQTNDHQRQERERHDQRRQEREQQGMPTLSKTQALLSHERTGVGNTGKGSEHEPSTCQRLAYQEQQTQPALSAGPHSTRYSHAEKAANLAPSALASVELPCVPPSNPLVELPLAPEPCNRGRFGSACASSTVAKVERTGGGVKPGPARKLGVVAVAVVSFSARTERGGLAS